MKDGTIVTYGERTLKLWTLKRESQGEGKERVWLDKVVSITDEPPAVMPKLFNCAAETQANAPSKLGVVAAGASNGSIYFFDASGKKTFKVEDAHPGGVNVVACVLEHADKSLLPEIVFGRYGWYTGGSDGVVRLWR